MTMKNIVYGAVLGDGILLSGCAGTPNEKEQTQVPRLTSGFIWTTD